MTDTARLERIATAPSVRRVTAGTPSLAEDAAQEARIAVWQVLERAPESVDAYLYATARKAALSVVRGRKATGAPDRSPGSARSAAHVESLDLLMTTDHDQDAADRTPAALQVHGWEDDLHASHAIRDALAALSMRDQRLLWLLALGHTQTAAASLLGVSRARVHQLLGRIRVALSDLQPA